MRMGDALLSNDMYYSVAGGNFFTINKKNIKLYNNDSLIDEYFKNNKIAMKNVVNELKKIKKSLILTSKKQHLMLIGMSVYIIYEKHNPQKCRAYLIDFAHSNIINEKHESEKYCINGIANLINKINNSLK